MERRTINDLEELKNVLESSSSTRIDAVGEEVEMSDVVVTNVDAEPGEDPLTSEVSPAPSAENGVAAAASSTSPKLESGKAAESSSAEAEVLSNVEHPPSHDEVVAGNTESSTPSVDVAQKTSTETIVMSFQNLRK